MVGEVAAFAKVTFRRTDRLFVCVVFGVGEDSVVRRVWLRASCAVGLLVTVGLGLLRTVVERFSVRLVSFVVVGFSDVLELLFTVLAVSDFDGETAGLVVGTDEFVERRNDFDE